MRDTKPVFCYVDGLHSGPFPYYDLLHCYENSQPDALIVVDDTENLVGHIGKIVVDFVENNDIEFLDLDECWGELWKEKSWHFLMK